MGKLYRVHDFAELAGVTVRALHHYDRLGLLKPQKTAAGYRLYAEKDLERLEQIIALKFLGLPLKQIKAMLLDRKALDLSDALRLQQAVLEEKRRLMDRAIGAIQDAENEIRCGQVASAAILRRIIEVIKMQEHQDFMKSYFGENAWVKWGQRREPWPSEPWIALFRDIQASLEEDPGSPRAHTLATRWMSLWLSDSSGDPELYFGLRNAWADRKHWPTTIQQRFADFDLERMTEFISKATLHFRKQYFSEEAWERLLKQLTPASREQRSLAWLTLFREAGAMLDEDPASDKAQDLVGRWLALARSGDPDIRAGYIKAWADRQNLPAPIQELQTLLDLDRITKFIRAGIDVRRKKFHEALGYLAKHYRDRPNVVHRPQKTVQARAKHLQARIQLFRDVAASLKEDPAGEIGQALAARWLELREFDTGGDAGVEEGIKKSWADRRNWPDALKQAWASTLWMDFETIDKVVEFINKAIAHRA
jgi:MerR family transcriptional regulator, thiopeptide resistance regulator